MTQIHLRVTYPRTGYVRPPVPVEQAALSETIISLGLGQQAPPDENVTGYRAHTMVILLLGRVAYNIISRPWGLPLTMSAVALALYFLSRVYSDLRRAPEAERLANQALAVATAEGNQRLVQVILAK